jgi:hypothetical protein
MKTSANSQQPQRLEDIAFAGGSQEDIRDCKKKLETYNSLVLQCRRNEISAVFL